MTNLKSMKKIYIWSLIAIVVILVIVYMNKQNTDNGISMQVNQPAQKEVNIGAVLSLTGYAAKDGNDIKKGIDLAAKELSQKGVKMTIDYQDDGTDPKKTISSIELLKSKNINKFIGFTWGYLASAAINTLETNNMTAYAPSDSSDIVAGATSTNNIYYGAINNYKKIEPTANWLKEKSAKRVAILSSLDAWGSVHTDLWKQAIEKAGAEAVIIEHADYADEASVIKVAVQKAKNSRVDTILWTGTEAGAIALISELEKQRMDTPVLGTKFIRIAVESKKANFKTGLYSIGTQISTEFESKFKNEYGSLPSEYSEAAYNMTLQIATSDNIDNLYDNNKDTRKGEWEIKEVVQ